MFKYPSSKVNFNHFIWQFISWWFDKYIQVSSRLLTSLLSLKISHNAAKNRQHHYWASKLSIIKTLLCSWKNTGSSYFPTSVVKLIVSGIFSFGYYLAPRWARPLKKGAHHPLLLGQRSQGTATPLWVSLLRPLFSCCPQAQLLWVPAPIPGEWRQQGTFLHSKFSKDTIGLK